MLERLPEQVNRFKGWCTATAKLTPSPAGTGCGRREGWRGSGASSRFACSPVQRGPGAESGRFSENPAYCIFPDRILADVFNPL